MSGGRAFRPAKVVSGGQTGVDRAGWDAAMGAGLPTGGWVPRGRRAEDGAVPGRYPARECPSPDYPARTELNVVDSDATLIVHRGPLDGGTKLTLDLCRRHRKPVCVVALDRLGPEEAEAEIRAFLERERPRVLNVAGPRESKSPGIHAAARDLLSRALAQA